MEQHGFFDNNHKNFLSRLLRALIIAVYFSYAQATNCYNDALQYNEITINVKPGDQFNVTCCIKNSSSCLNITDRNQNYFPNIQTLHESAIQLTDTKARGVYDFTCLCDGKAFLVTNVNVDTSPKHVDDFECVVLEFLQMQCTINKTAECINTIYELLIEGSQVNRSGYNMPSEKETIVYLLESPYYSIGRKNYHFSFTASNEMGHYVVNKSFDQYSLVKPQLHDVKLSKITTDGVTLSWNVLNVAAYKNHTGGLIFNISIGAEKFNFFKDVDDSEIENHNDQFLVKISNLYSFVEFKMFLRVKANSSANIEEMWSKEYEASFTTLPSPPKNSPAIDVGSFYLHPERKNITLFWRQLPECEQNGPNFTYQISNIKENEQIIKNLIPPTKKTFVTIPIDWKNTSQYEFTLESKNQNGPSLSKSILRIGPRYSNIRTHEENIEPVTKLFYNQTYKVSWLKPINFKALSSFTLFWCTTKGSDNQCMGPINFKNLDRNAVSYTTTEKLNRFLNFALSENYYNNSYSSGMMWAKKCSLHPESNSFRFKLNNITIPTEDSITVHWVEECWHKTIIDGYNMTYCEIKTNKCITHIISDKTAKSYKIINLKPSTSYNITITIIPKNKLDGLISDSIVKQTKNAKNTTKDIIIASFSIIGVVALIVLVHYSKKKLCQILDIKSVLPSERDMKYSTDQSASFRLMNTEDYKENKFSINLPPFQGMTAQNHYQ